jgi:hypothetical protein
MLSRVELATMVLVDKRFARMVENKSVKQYSRINRESKSFLLQPIRDSARVGVLGLKEKLA